MRSFAGELAAVASTTLARAHADLLRSSAGPPRALAGPRQHPHGDRRNAPFAGNPGTRRHPPRRPAGTCGWARAFDSLTVDLGWKTNGRIEIHALTGPSHRIQGARLTPVPNGFAGQWLSLDPPRAYAFHYPARGTAGLREAAPPPADGVDRLIGQIRARLLGAFHAPATISSCSRQTGSFCGQSWNETSSTAPTCWHLRLGPRLRRV